MSREIVRARATDDAVARRSQVVDRVQWEGKFFLRRVVGDKIQLVDAEDHVLVDDLHGTWFKRSAPLPRVLTVFALGWSDGVSLEVTIETQPVRRR